MNNQLTKMKFNMSRRVLQQGSSTPWYTDFIAIVALIIVFLIILRILMSISKRWKQMMKKRIDVALEKRKLYNDPFRADNGYSWDYVMVFKVFKNPNGYKIGSTTIPGDTLTEIQKKHNFKFVIDRLAEAGLQTKLFYSVQNDEVYCKIRAPLKRLMKEADRVNLRLPLEPNMISNILQAGHLTGPIETQWKPFEIPSNSLETDIEPYEYIYGEFDLLDRDKLPLYKKTKNSTIFRGVDRLKLIAGILSARTEQGGCHLDVYRLITDECMLAFFPLHDLVELRELEEQWIRFIQAPWRQRTEKVKDYFGEKIGMYFTWLGHYTTWLLYAAIVGFFAWINVAADANNPNAADMPYFAVFIAVWATLYLEYWKRKEKTCAMQWGMVGAEAMEQERAEFQGEYQPSPVDGEPRLYFPRSEFYVRVARSSFAISFLICLVIAAVAGIFVFKLAYQTSQQLVVGNANQASTVASLMNAVQIQVMNYIYSSASIALNDYENHRTETEYEDALIGKTFVFQFVNSFSSLFYISFVKPFISNIDACIPGCLTELQNALGTIFLTRLATGNILKILLPYIDQKMRQMSETQGNSGAMKEMSEIEKMYMLTPYHVTIDTFTDYAEMTIQFGYTTMFIVAYPLATVLAFVNNYVEMRVEAWKLCQLCRRPEPRSCEDIGTWNPILEITTFIAVVTNSALIAFTGKFTIGLSWDKRIWIFIGTAAGIYLLKITIQALVPDVPPEVDIQLQRQQLIIDKIFNNVGDDDIAVEKRSVKIKTEYTIRITDDDPL